MYYIAVICLSGNVYVQHRCVSIFLDRKANAANPPPVGFALGSIEGRVAIHYVNPTNPKDNFTFKCHRSNGTTSSAQDIYAVIAINSILFVDVTDNYHLRTFLVSVPFVCLVLCC